MTALATLSWGTQSASAPVADEADAATLKAATVVLLRALCKLPAGSVAVFAAEGPLRGAGAREAHVAGQLLAARGVAVHPAEEVPPGCAVTHGLYHVDGEQLLVEVEGAT